MGEERGGKEEGGGGGSGNALPSDVNCGGMRRLENVPNDVAFFSNVKSSTTYPHYLSLALRSSSSKQPECALHSLLSS